MRLEVPYRMLARMARRNPGLHHNVCLHQGGICMRRKTIFALATAAILLLVVAGASAQGNLTQNEQLGKNLFFDTNLSTPSGLACAGCHGAEVGRSEEHTSELQSPCN